MKLTIISPLYNVNKYLDEYFSSIVSAQKKSKEVEIEIILVNDASPEDPSNIIEKWSKKLNNFKYIVSETNGGPGNARNLGQKFISPDSNYVFFLDSDDILEDRSFDFLSEHEADVLLVEKTEWFCDFYNERVSLQKNNKNNSQNKFGAENDPYIKIVKTDIVKDIKWLNKYYEDTIWTGEIFHKAKSHFWIDEKISKYRINFDSITNSDISKEKFDDFVFSYKFMLEKNWISKVQYNKQIKYIKIGKSISPINKIRQFYEAANKIQRRSVIDFYKSSGVKRTLFNNLFWSKVYLLLKGQLWK